MASKFRVWPGREMDSRFPGTCVSCGSRFEAGERIYFRRPTDGAKGEAFHLSCKPADSGVESSVDPFAPAPDVHWSDEAIESAKHQSLWKLCGTLFPEVKGSLWRSCTGATMREALRSRTVPDSVRVATQAGAVFGVAGGSAENGAGAVPAVSVDLDAVRKLVTEEVAKARLGSVSVSVSLPGRPEPVKLDGYHHAAFWRILDCVSLRIHCYLYGPAGTGKSTVARPEPREPSTGPRDSPRGPFSVPTVATISGHLAALARPPEKIRSTGANFFSMLG